MSEFLVYSRFGDDELRNQRTPCGDSCNSMPRCRSSSRTLSAVSQSTPLNAKRSENTMNRTGIDSTRERFRRRARVVPAW